jgi:hypothetical protein
VDLLCLPRCLLQDTRALCSEIIVYSSDNFDFHVFRFNSRSSSVLLLSPQGRLFNAALEGEKRHPNQRFFTW